jgi:hypothetical protein
MRFPVKLNADRIPAALRGFLPCMPSPVPLVANSDDNLEAGWERVQYSARVSSLQSAGTWKTTWPGRHTLTEQLIEKLVGAGWVDILDVGVSDGSTVLDLIRRLGSRFFSYYATDRTLRVQCETEGRVARFYEADGHCICVATPWLVVYPEDKGSSLLHRWAQRFLPLPGVASPGKRRQVDLIQPELRKLAETDPRLIIREYDLLCTWDGPKVDLAKAANVLNRTYFSDDKITLALRNLHEALKDGGHLILTENREAGREQASVFRRVRQRFQTLQSVGGGSDIADLVERWNNGPPLGGSW